MKFYPLAMPTSMSTCFETANIIMESRMQESRTYGSVSGLRCKA